MNIFRDVGMAKPYLPNVARVPDPDFIYGLNLLCWYLGVLFFHPQKNNVSDLQLNCESEDNTFVRCNTVMCYCYLFNKLTSVFDGSVLVLIMNFIRTLSK